MHCYPNSDFQFNERSVSIEELWINPNHQMSNKIDNMSKNHRSKRSSTNQKPMLVKVNHNRKIDSELYQCEYVLNAEIMAPEA